MRSFCQKFDEFAVTDFHGNRPVYLYEPGDWRSEKWLEASLKSPYPVPYKPKVLKVAWGRRLRCPRFGLDHAGEPGHQRYPEAYDVAVKHWEDYEMSWKESARALESLLREVH